jgi:hypothetical protein
MEQTAVEYLIEQLFPKALSEEQYYHIEKAKEMEKNQHDKTAEDWWNEGAHYVETQGQHQTESFDKYYEERFKK